MHAILMVKCGIPYPEQLNDEQFAEKWQQFIWANDFLSRKQF
jgi:hypothetical protein